MAVLRCYTSSKESLNEQKKMVEFFPPILDHFCPFLEQIAHCSDGSQAHFIQMGGIGVSFCPEYHAQPCSLLSSHILLLGIGMHTKHLQPHSKTPIFFAWTSKWVKWTTIWAKWDPSWQFVQKADKTFPEVGKNIHSSEEDQADSRCSRYIALLWFKPCSSGAAVQCSSKFAAMQLHHS